MSKRIVGAAFLAAGLLSGCVPSEGEWNTARAMVQGSPAMHREMVSQCIATSDRASPAAKQQWAKIMNVSTAKVTRIWCARAVRAFADGRLTYEQARRMRLQSGDRSEFIKIIQGR